MTEGELENLKDLPVPGPGADARARALAAALSAFEGEKNNSLEGTQGTDEAARPISTSHSGIGRKPMRSLRSNYAMAASIAALVVAVPALLLAIRGPF